MLSPKATIFAGVLLFAFMVGIGVFVGVTVGAFTVGAGVFVGIMLTIFAVAVGVIVGVMLTIFTVAVGVIVGVMLTIFAVAMGVLDGFMLTVSQVALVPFPPVVFPPVAAGTTGSLMPSVPPVCMHAEIIAIGSTRRRQSTFAADDINDNISNIYIKLCKYILVRPLWPEVR